MLLRCGDLAKNNLKRYVQLSCSVYHRKDLVNTGNFGQNLNTNRAKLISIFLSLLHIVIGDKVLHYFVNSIITYPCLIVHSPIITENGKLCCVWIQNERAKQDPTD